MSIYYYMACDAHRARTKEIIAVTRIAGEHLDHQPKLLQFLLAHRDCDLRFFSEFDDERNEYAPHVGGAK